MPDRVVNFTYIGKRFKLDIPFSLSHVINLYLKLSEHLTLASDATITLFVTLTTGKQHIFKPEETIDSFIEKSKGGIVTVYVKAKPHVQAQAYYDEGGRRIAELKPNEELHMVNRGPHSHEVIEGKKAKALNTGTCGLTIDLGCGASVHIPKGHELLSSGKKIGFQQIKPKFSTFGGGISPVVNLELLDD